MMLAAFIVLLVVLPPFYGWHLLGYFNGRWDRCSVEQQARDSHKTQRSTT